VDRAAGRAQGSDKQAAVGLDRHRDRVLGGIAMVGEHLQQHREAGGVVVDPPLGQQAAGLVDQGHVVVRLGPVDPAGDPHAGPFVEAAPRRDAWSRQVTRATY
jgi:hypothetical protein